MKKLIVLLGLFLVACQPSQRSIDIAVAQTVAAMKLPTLSIDTLVPTNIEQSPTIKPASTSTPEPTSLPTVTNTPKPTTLPTVTSTPKATNSPMPTNPPQIGTFNNPVPIGQDVRFPGFGNLKVVKSLWKPNQTGYAIIQLTFKCERPADQECRTADFMMDAIGKSGKGYKKDFSSAIPEPDFGSIFNGKLYGGGSETGYVGFLITDSEQSLIMLVKIFLKDDKIYFRISP